MEKKNSKLPSFSSPRPPPSPPPPLPPKHYNSLWNLDTNTVFLHSSRSLTITSKFVKSSILQFSATLCYVFSHSNLPLDSFSRGNTHVSPLENK